MDDTDMSETRVLMPRGRMSEGLTEHLRRRGARGELGLVANLAELDRRYEVAARVAAAHSVQLLYAVKACTHPEVLARAARFGLGFDIANARELAHARSASSEALVSLTSPALPMLERKHLYAAFASGGISRWHCDSLSQLEELARTQPGSAVGVRVNLDGLAIPESMPMYRSSRFGLRLDQLPQAREIAAKHGCSVRWLHMHNGSEENDVASYVFAARQILDAARACDIEVQSLDLGGGLVAEPTEQALTEFFGPVREEVGPDVQLVFEPGRFWMADCMALVTQVLDVKELIDKVVLILDMGTLSHMYWSEWLRIPALGQLRPNDPRPWRICGRSCFEEDMLDDWEKVPLEDGAPIPRVGDCVVLGNITGYALELNSDFNGVTPPTLELVEL